MFFVICIQKQLNLNSPLCECLTKSICIEIFSLSPRQLICFSYLKLLNKIVNIFELYIESFTPQSRKKPAPEC